MALDRVRYPTSCERTRVYRLRVRNCSRRHAEPAGHCRVHEFNCCLVGLETVSAHPVSTGYLRAARLTGHLDPTPPCIHCIYKRTGGYRGQQAGTQFHIPEEKWCQPEGSADGIWEQTLTRDETVGSATVVQRYEPGVDGTPLGVITHTFWEEVHFISGYLTDETFGETFGPGMYACRPPGMQHGQYSSSAGV